MEVCTAQIEQLRIIDAAELKGGAMKHALRIALAGKPANKGAQQNRPRWVKTRRSAETYAIDSADSSNEHHNEAIMEIGIQVLAVENARNATLHHPGRTVECFGKLRRYAAG